MANKTILTICLMFFFNMSFGQDLWTRIPSEKIINKGLTQRTSTPKKPQLYSLNVDALKAVLATAPIENTQDKSATIVEFPNSNGKLTSFKIFESPVMEAELAAKYPNIKTYVGQGVDDATAIIRFSLTEFGLHTIASSGNAETNYIDAYTTDLSTYIVYKKNDLTKSKNFQCDLKDKFNINSKTEDLNALSNKTATNDGKYRVYRLAMACTGEYAAYHGGTKSLALAAIVVTVNRVNLLYERDLAVRLNLVANNDLLMYTNATNDPYTNDDGPLMIDENQANIDNIIGSANYDIGHVVSTGGGGVALLGSVCSSDKAGGVTGSNAPVGDAFDIDYVAHEIGHQFGCDHTFSSNRGSCLDNLDAGAAVEPGSGTTIMAYAGICSTDNVQSNSDDYFSTVSIAQATERILQATSCALTTTNGNNAPVVNAGSDYTIPIGTAFILKGSATDADGDSLTYCWEQIDTESSTQPPVRTATGGPNFRSLPPTTSPERYMPSINNVIANNLFSKWEVVSNVARTMNFALTVRDNKIINGGQTGIDNTKITIASVGPFRLNSPNTAVVWSVGSNQNVTWTVAETTANGINAAFVDILLSTDGGYTYPILLASKVPNDGSETITVPNNVGTTNRIMVRGYNHIFYDISNTDFEITAAASTFAVAFSGVEGTQYRNACNTNSATFDIEYTTYGGYNQSTSFSAVGNPSGTTVSFSPSTTSTSGTVAVTIGNLTAASNGTYKIDINGTSLGTTKTVPLYLQLGLETAVLTEPTDNAVDQDVTTILKWNFVPNATTYDVEIATNISFSPIFKSETVSSNSYTVSDLTEGTVYFWRVKANNDSCIGTFSNAFNFTTFNLSCETFTSTDVPKTISSSGTPTVTSTLNILNGGIVGDLNVSMNIRHTYLEDLTISLTSPSNNTVVLLDAACGTYNNMNATFDDDLGITITCAATSGNTNNSISGIVLPDNSLSAFNGEDSTGSWTLTVNDAYDGDGGSILSWSLDLCAIVPLSTEKHELDKFVLFPNPNQGNFTIQFNSFNQNMINVDVFEISGKRVYRNSYTNLGGKFSQEINLGNLQTGVYIVSISDGQSKTLKRVIVE